MQDQIIGEAKGIHLNTHNKVKEVQPVLVTRVLFLVTTQVSKTEFNSHVHDTLRSPIRGTREIVDISSAPGLSNASQR